jgi:Mn-containing catalase
VLVARLYEMTDDPGMKDMLWFLIARDTMHQQQWLAVIEELGGPEQLPIPNSFPREHEKHDVSYAFLTTTVDGDVPEGRWSRGRSLDGHGEFRTERAKPMGDEPVLSSPPRSIYAQSEQQERGIVDKVKDAVR